MCVVREGRRKKLYGSSPIVDWIGEFSLKRRFGALNELDVQNL